MPGCAADDEHRAGGVLRVAAPRARDGIEERRRRAADARSSRPRARCPRRRRARRGTARARRRARPSGAWKVTVRSASTAAPAISPVDASTPDGRSTETTGARGRVDPLDQLGGLRPRLAAGTPCRRARRRRRRSRRARRRLVRDVPRLAEDARRDAPVAAVRAAAADAREAPRRRVREHRLARDRRPRPLHQLGDRVGVVRDTAPRPRASPRRCRAARSGSAHRRAGSRRRSPPRSRASASSRGRSAPAWTRSANAAVRPERRTPGFGRPTISISFHVKRTPQPSALPTASLPAKRAA